MREEICYTLNSANSIPIDLNPNQFKKAYGLEYYQVKPKIQGQEGKSGKKGKSVFPIPFVKEAPEGEGKSKTRNYIMAKVPFETAPLIHAYICASLCTDPSIAPKKYLETLRNVAEDYFAICRDTDPDFQQLYTDFLCMDPLVSRLSMILVLSKMGTPEKRPGMLLDCLGELEGLISRLQENYFPNGYIEPRKIVIDTKTGAPFDKLYKRLSAHRAMSGEKAMVLAWDDSSTEQKKLAKELNRALSGLCAERAPIHEHERRDYARKIYAQWLITNLNEEEKLAAEEFSNKIIQLEAYLRTPDQNVTQKVQRMLYSNLYGFAHQLLRDNIDVGELSTHSLDLDPLPPEALFLEREITEAALKIMKTAMPYISLNNALQGIDHIAAHVINNGLPSILEEETAAMLLAGTQKIITAVTSQLPKMLSIAGFQKESDNPLRYIREHPIESIEELNALFKGYCEDCQCDMSLKCMDCTLQDSCPYHKYAEWDIESFQGITTVLATEDSTKILKGIMGLTLLYTMEVNVMVCRVAAFEAENLFHTWQRHCDANEDLSAILKKKKIIDQILNLASEL